MRRDAVALAWGLVALVAFPLSLSSCGSSSDEGRSSTGTSASSSASGQKVAHFGSEASGGQARQVESTLQGYLAAVSQERWAEACGYLAEKVRKARAGLARARHLEGEGCAAGLEASAEGLSDSERSGLDRAEVTSVRTKGKRGYVRYDDASGGERAMPIVAEGGDWKLFLPFSVQGVSLSSK